MTLANALPAGVLEEQVRMYENWIREKEKNSNATTTTQQITATAPPLDAQVIPTVTDAVVISEPVEPKAAQSYQLEK